MTYPRDIKLLGCLFIVVMESFTFAYHPNVTAAIMVERATRDYSFNINRSIGVLELAIEKAKEIVNQHANLNFIIYPVDMFECSAFKFGALAAEAYYVHKTAAFIGPGCSNAVEVIARLAAAWNLPVITFAGTSTTLGNKTEFATLTRLGYTMEDFARFYLNIFQMFGWTDVANVYNSSDFLFNVAGSSLQMLISEDQLSVSGEQLYNASLREKVQACQGKRYFELAGVKVHAIPFTHRLTSEESELAPEDKREFIRLLNKAKKVSRVFLLACSGLVLRHLALLATELGMKSGEYSILFFIPDTSIPTIGNFDWKRGDQYDLAAREAYYSVMIVILRMPEDEKFIEFQTEAINRSRSSYMYEWPVDPQLGIIQVAQYDSIIVYAHALKASFESGLDYRNGKEMLTVIWNKTYPSISGQVHMKEDGDKEADIALLDLDPVTGKFHMVARNFAYNFKLELLPDTPIHWPNNAGPPPNVPKCGYLGELCVTYQLGRSQIITIAFAVVLVCMATVGILIFRRVQRETAIQSEWWKIQWNELHLQGSLIASRPSVGCSGTGMEPTHVSGNKYFGIYKDMPVHIRRLKIKSLNVDRKLQVELKEMRDVNCPNLTRLVGLCVQTNNICIISEHCSRGNLQDLLLNDESMQLDRDFRLSLVNDIVQGMHYIHTSPIHVHGRLSNTTCVIDSRFVLKIESYGLRSIDDYFQGESDTNEGNTSELFYTAPELLRSYPPRQCSQPGDVYSFAIILYEICTRTEPYTNELRYQSVEDTLKDIKSQRSKPRRPSFGNNNAYPELYDLAEECWQEKPEERPSFRDIRRRIESLKRGIPHGTNVLDMLLHRMEKYANNLEGLVEEKTKAVLEEKKLTEELLYQVLPKTVADQLKIGKCVLPESFEMVTIFVSDIVGFTAISAASTPLQVVDFLNDIYGCFDEIIESFDVYKVETIGDAYMVTSGLPVRNENEHARQIARMSLKIVEQIQQFVIRHQPDSPLMARIGIHSGPVVAGVVGQKMPRYCLFGDTVYTASLMESHGLPMRIHISDPTRQLLEFFGNFIIEERGSIEIKEKESMVTHWLNGEVQQAQMPVIEASYTDVKEKLSSDCLSVANTEIY